MVLLLLGFCSQIPDSTGLVETESPSQMTEPEFVDAVMRGEYERIQRGLQAGIDPNSANRFGDTALIWAAHNRDIGLVRTLLKRGADPNRSGSYRKTAMHWAAEADSLDLIEMLVAAGAHISPLDHQLRTPMFGAAERNHLQTLKFLIAKGADVNWSDGSGETPIFSAARAGKGEAVEFLVLNGANLDQVSSKQETPIDIIIKSDRRSMLETPAIIEKFPDLRAKLERHYETRILNAAERPVLKAGELPQMIHKLVNRERQKMDLINLEFDESLANIAAEHSRDMGTNGFFAHINSKQEDPTIRAMRAGYTVIRQLSEERYKRGIGENIYSGWLFRGASIEVKSGVRWTRYQWKSVEEIAADAVSGWMESPGHRANILNGQYLRQGIGIHVTAEDKILITQNFF